MDNRQPHLGARLAGLCWLGAWICGVVMLVQDGTSLFCWVLGQERHGRQLQYGQADPGSLRQVRSQRLISLIQTFVFAGVVVLELLTLFAYWQCYIKPTAAMYIRRHQVIPDDLKGSWKISEFDCCAMPGTFMCALFCGPCVAADLWYRAGWIHGALDADKPGSGFSRDYFPGWLWCVGVGGYCFAEGTLACFMPCLFAWQRGGIPGDTDNGGGGNGVTPFRLMFGMPSTGWSTFCSDCCCYCFCGPCLMTQEYYQVMEVLKRPAVIQAPPTVAVSTVIGTVPTVVGQPVTVAPAPAEVEKPTV